MIDSIVLQVDLERSKRRIDDPILQRAVDAIVGNAVARAERVVREWLEPVEQVDPAVDMALLSMLAPRREPRGRIYFIEAVGSGYIKIGWTAGDVGRRLDALQVGSPYDLRLLAALEGPRSGELEHHGRFHHLRVRGEWFRDSIDLRRYIVAVNEVDR